MIPRVFSVLPSFSALKKMDVLEKDEAGERDGGGRSPPQAENQDETEHSSALIATNHDSAGGARLALISGD